MNEWYLSDIGPCIEPSYTLQPQKLLVCNTPLRKHAQNLALLGMFHQKHDPIHQNYIWPCSHCFGSTSYIFGSAASCNNPLLEYGCQDFSHIRILPEALKKRFSISNTVKDIGFPGYPEEIKARAQNNSKIHMMSFIGSTQIQKVCQYQLCFGRYTV